MTCCPHTMWQTAAIAHCRAFLANVPCLPYSVRSGRRAPTSEVGLFVPPPPPTCVVACCDVSSRSASDHATEAVHVVAVCWCSRQRGRAARSVQTPHGSARRHVRRSSQNPKIRVRFRELSERGIIPNPKIPSPVPVSKGAKRAPPRTAKLL